MTLLSFIYMIRKNINLNKSQGLFITIGDSKLVSNRETLGDLYADYKNEDGFLYINYTTENVFG